MADTAAALAAQVSDRRRRIVDDAADAARILVDGDASDRHEAAALLLTKTVVYLGGQLPDVDGPSGTTLAWHLEEVSAIAGDSEDLRSPDIGSIALELRRPDDESAFAYFDDGVVQAVTDLAVTVRANDDGVDAGLAEAFCALVERTARTVEDTRTAGPGTT